MQETVIWLGIVTALVAAGAFVVVAFRRERQDKSVRVLKKLAAVMDARKENLVDATSETLLTLLVPQHARTVMLWQDFTDELPTRIDQPTQATIPLEKWKTFQGLSRQPWLYAALRQGEVLAIDDVSALPEHATRERKALRDSGVDSVLFVPVLHHGRLVAVYGLVGEAGHVWHKAQIVSVLLNLLTAVLMGHSKAYLSPLSKGVSTGGYDALTGLPNRLLAIHELENVVAHRKGKCIACIVVGLDNFKRINETLGHSEGDALLQEAAGRLKQQIQTTDTVARLGGDEFLVILSKAKKDDAERLATHLKDAFTRPFIIGKHTVTVTASTGIALYPDDGADARTLLRNADSAMHRAKDSGRNTFQFYAREMHEDALKRVEMEQQLRRAIERDELKLYYQPIINAKTGKIDGAEGLLRWFSAKLGFVSPLDFIPLAEDIGEIVPIGLWVLETACSQMKVWEELEGAPEFVTVNVSAKQIEKGEFSAQVQDILKRTKVKPGRIHLEVTESLLMSNAEHVESELAQLAGMGIHISLDDFGTGYSSLSYLKRYNFNTLKIDRSFVRDVPEDPEDKALIEAIMVMAHSLKMSVVAEGVETEEQRLYLTGLHCDQLQGYFFSQPLPAEKFQIFVNNWQAKV